MESVKKPNLRYCDPSQLWAARSDDDEVEVYFADEVRELEAEFAARTAEVIVHSGQALACSAPVAEAYRQLEAKLESIKPIAWWIHGPVGATALVFSRNDIEPRIAELAKQYNADPSDFTATTFYAESFDHVR